MNSLSRNVETVVNDCKDNGSGRVIARNDRGIVQYMLAAEWVHVAEGDFIMVSLMNPGGVIIYSFPLKETLVPR